MDSDPLGTTNAGTRKVRFAPKVPPRPRRTTKSTETKIEVTEDAEAAQTRDLLRRLNEGSGRGKPKIEKKSTPAQVAFGFGHASNFIRSYAPPKGSSSSRSQDGVNASGHIVEKEYKEPWNYYSYYPVTLPVRRPYSGNPVLLDEDEFGVASADMAYDENSMKSAIELGLMEENEEARMIFLQLPTSLPLVKRSTTAEGDQINGSSRPSKGVGPSEKACSLEELPAGCMGKMLVYKSGAIKLQLGDTLYDVSPGSDCVFAQDVVAINTEEKHCCVVGELNKRAIVTPDVDSLLNNMANLD